MKAKILSNKKTIFDGNCQLIQLPGVDGLFEILDNHDNMIATLAKGTIKIGKEDETEQFIEINGGFLEVGNNTVSILVDLPTK